jgi:hypothetical protein
MAEISSQSRTGQSLGETAMVPVRLAMGIIDAPLRWVQKKFGLGGMAAFFLLPNMLIFGVFVLLPFFINHDRRHRALPVGPHLCRCRSVYEAVRLLELFEPQYLR